MVAVSSVLDLAAFCTFHARSVHDGFLTNISASFLWAPRTADLGSISGGSIAMLWIVGYQIELVQLGVITVADNRESWRRWRT